MELRDNSGILRRRGWLIVLMAIRKAGTANVLSSAQQLICQAAARLLITSSFCWSGLNRESPAGRMAWSGRCTCRLSVQFPMAISEASYQ
jgi:hypothetical protein